MINEYDYTKDDWDELWDEKKATKSKMVADKTETEKA